MQSTQTILLLILLSSLPTHSWTEQPWQYSWLSCKWKWVIVLLFWTTGVLSPSTGKFLLTKNFLCATKFPKEVQMQKQFLTVAVKFSCSSEDLPISIECSYNTQCLIFGPWSVFINWLYHVVHFLFKTTCQVAVNNSYIYTLIYTQKYIQCLGQNRPYSSRIKKYMLTTECTSVGARIQVSVVHLLFLCQKIVIFECAF